ncbi:hypothetical protein SCHPADRAFT_897470 [Schizopora paradoxa]|uniref:Uncharacterized protein n=1 Tax=Schizopora paradoxa TaxID=27342 RepID=A0A0H2QX21_9AGAM|nr:hypothetical protein SCHPADRAFT_897470 [Schizopora paradoxa]
MATISSDVEIITLKSGIYIFVIICLGANTPLDRSAALRCNGSRRRSRNNGETLGDSLRLRKRSGRGRVVEILQRTPPEIPKKERSTLYVERQLNVHRHEVVKGEIRVPMFLRENPPCRDPYIMR